MHGELWDELRDLFGIEFDTHYDEIEGADHLPYALLGQGGVYRDIATVSAFQEKSESDQLSWLLQNSFIITYTSGDGEADESEVDESSGTTTTREATTSTRGSEEGVTRGTAGGANTTTQGKESS